MAIIYDMTDEAYFARPELSASGVKKLLMPGGPARFRWEQDHGQPHRKAFDIGHAAHALVLGVGAPVEAYPDEVLGKTGSTATTAAKEWAADARERGVVPLTRAEFDMVHAMADEIRRHPRIHELSNAAMEVVLTGDIFGVPFRGKLDILHDDGGVVDYKTSKSLVDPDTFTRTVARYGYHLQDWCYRELMRQNGIGDPTFEFLAQEKDAPYLAGWYELDDIALKVAEQQVEKACQLYLDCTATDTWPGYPTGTQLIGLPTWAFDDDEEMD